MLGASVVNKSAIVLQFQCSINSFSISRKPFTVRFSGKDDRMNYMIVLFLTIVYAAGLSSDAGIIKKKPLSFL